MALKKSSGAASGVARLSGAASSVAELSRAASSIAGAGALPDHLELSSKRTTLPLRNVADSRSAWPLIPLKSRLKSAKSTNSDPEFRNERPRRVETFSSVTNATLVHRSKIKDEFAIIVEMEQKLKDVKNILV